MEKGFALGWVVSNDGTTPLLGPRDIAALTDLGARVVCISPRLGAQPGWQEALLDRFATVILQLTRAGIEVIGLLSHEIVHAPKQADWNNGNREIGPDGGGLTPAYQSFVNAYVSAARQLAARLPAITRWQVWNEPNAWTHHDPGSNTFTGGTFIYPGLYARLLERAYMAIKAIQPESTVISGALFGHNIGGALTRQSSGAAYLESVCRALANTGSRARPPFDALGQHLYLDRGGAVDPSHPRTCLDFLRTVPLPDGRQASGLPIYITEAGWSTRDVSPDVQASNLRTLLQICRSQRDVAAICWFLVRDNPPANLFFGLCAPDWTRKPAFSTFTEVS